jgi:phosphomethylpyrimidine synthase
MEARKVRAAVEAGADAIMDLSTAGDLDAIRRLVLEIAPVPVGSVPVYQAAAEAVERRGSVVAMTAEDIFDAGEKQAADGVDFMAIHCALTFEVLERLAKVRRVTDIVSRGGAFLAAWMLHHRRENPLYEQFDRLLDILREYDVLLSLSDGVRPGAIADSLDAVQVQGLLVTGELVLRAREKGLQVMVEGPGHVPLHHVEATVRLEKRLCYGAPYFVLGMLATDVAPGYDHISAAVGGALAAASGADFICAVTPAEHLGLPNEEDIRLGVVAARVAAYVGDLAKGVNGALERDRQMACARVCRDVRDMAALALDSTALARLREGDGLCRACEECALQLVLDYFQAGVFGGR